MRLFPSRLLGPCLLIVCSMACVALPAQSLGWQFGMGTSYDYGVGLPAIAGYAPYGKGQAAAVTFDVFLGIPFGRLCFYPSYQFSIPTRQMRIQNLHGAYIPGGYDLSLPFSDQNPDVVYGDNYYDLSAWAEVWQHKVGTYAMLHLGGGVELGSGLFWRQKRTHVYANVLYDAYDYVGSVGTQTDEYSYDATYVDHVEMTQIRTNSLAIPLVMQWRYSLKNYYVSSSVTRWIGGGDGFWSFRYVMGLQF